MIFLQREHIYKAIVLMLCLAFVYLFIRDNGKKAKDKLLGLVKEPWVMLFLFYTAYLIAATVMGRSHTSPVTNVWGSFGIWGESGRINEDLVINVLMGIPFSFLFIMAFRPERPIRRAMAAVACAATFLELSQLIGWLGYFQLADIIHNVIGGAIGCGIWWIGKTGQEKH